MAPKRRNRGRQPKPVEKMCAETMEVLERYPSVTAAGIANNVSHGAISKCLTGKTSTTGGKFVWRYFINEDVNNDLEDHESDADSKKPRYNLKPVQKMCIHTGRVLCTFGSMTEAAQCHNMTTACISNACHGRSHTAGGFRWRLLSRESDGEGLSKPQSEPRPAGMEDTSKIDLESGEEGKFERHRDPSQLGRNPIEGNLSIGRSSVSTSHNAPVTPAHSMSGHTELQNESSSAPEEDHGVWKCQDLLARKPAYSSGQNLQALSEETRHRLQQSTMISPHPLIQKAESPDTKFEESITAYAAGIEINHGCADDESLSPLPFNKKSPKEDEGNFF